MYLPCCLSPNFGYHECEDWTVLVLLGIEKHLQVQLLGPNFSDTLAGNSGATLPEVGWFCHDCCSKTEHDKMNQVLHVQSQATGKILPVPIFSERQPSLANDLTWPREGTPQLGSVERAPQSDANRVTQTGARTLSRCRNV
ncbi:hypothetical protein GH714_043239 [Hevea brasiliensis]|uniref:Uncharacterized protein n=1 Tax=Hevea brasiliensis TaxID=3981 RepID=A0A6A6K2G3_HEVBR|nr:hypothetical protein GH714_043239 [Hevea brasiliensis]